jgi:DNA-binding NtrC family response regulator
MSFHSRARSGFILRRAAADARPHAPRILIVDDQQMIRAAIADDLAHEGYDIAQAENATEAIALIGGGASYELILTDIDMPGPFNGLHLAEFVKYVSPTTCVVVMSGGSHPAGHPGAIDLFLAKPTPSIALRRHVADMLGRPPGR